MASQGSVGKDCRIFCILFGYFNLLCNDHHCHHYRHNYQTRHRDHDHASIRITLSK